MTSPSTHRLWIGTYPGDGRDPGTGEGVWRVTVDVATGALDHAEQVAVVGSPAFLARHPSAPVLCAVTETTQGSLTAWRLADDGGLDHLVTLDSGGAGPCHVVLDERACWVTNYGDGVAAAYGTSSDGVPVAAHRSLHLGSGSGPVTDRQEGPHAHQATVVGDHVLVTDLGADVVRRYPVDPSPSDQGETAAQLPAGTGPRHLVVLPSGALVVAGELDAHLHVLVPTEDGWEHAGSVPVSPSAEGEAFPGHVTLSADGRRLHVGLRGPDVLAVHDVHDGALPRLEHVADVALGAGGWPRHHEVVADDAGTELLVVALQRTSELVSVRVSPAGTGEVVARAPWATPPSCVLVEP
ncbi:lactonase family protein [Isoptericola jiangsuensis]|uniref:lactonase family protein n=1 Tax=Isoptericola jiangsuensis TaxID=548579 RepID=UPI003AAED200